MKALVVLNPAAGKDTDGAVREALDLHFGASRIQFEIRETREGDSPGEVLREGLRDGFDLAVVAGGDGTVSGAIDSLSGSTIPLGIIPTGTGNLIARELGLPEEVDEAVRLIAGEPRRRRIDAMRIGRRVFVLNASVGVSASVISDTTALNKRRFGRIAYFLSTVPKMFTLKPRRLVVTVDGLGQEYRAIEVAVMNCGMLARTLYPNGPEIRIDDGCLDVLILGTKPIRDYPRFIFAILAGRNAGAFSRFIRSERCITIRSSTTMAVQADGDMIGTTPVDIELVPGAVTVLVPQDGAKEPS